MENSECCLCSQIAGCESNDLIAKLLPGQPYVRRVLMETELFSAIPSLAPLAPGHCLVCPKAHIRRFASLRQSDYSEFRDLRTQLTLRLMRQYGGKVHLFEHGMEVTGDRILCTVDHAHMHFVPLPPSFLEAVLENQGWIEFDGSLQELKRLCKSGEYVFYESPEGKAKLLLNSHGKFESQYMRQIVAKGLSKPDDWNWRQKPDALSADLAWRSFAR